MSTLTAPAKKSTRINHLKAALDPAQYVCLAPLYLGSVSSDEQGEAVDSVIVDMFETFAEVNRLSAYAAPLGGAEVRELVAERGVDGRFAKRGTCDHCGASFKFGYLFEHVTSKQVIVVGRTCGQEFAVTSKDALAMLRLEKGMQTAAETIKRNKARAAFLAKHDGLAEALKCPHHISGDLARKLHQYGSLSVAQIGLARRLAADAAAKAEVAAASPSVYLGTVGERQEFTAVLAFCRGFDTDFGTTYINKLVDAAGNVIVYKGSKDFRDEGVAIGDTLTFAGTVKAHTEYQDIKQTQVSRPKIK